MYLKIRHAGSWWIYGDLKKIKYRCNLYMRKELEEMVNWDAYLISLPVTMPEDKQYEFYEFVIRDSDDQETLIIMDETAYICNEKGSTIEKICCCRPPEVD